MVKITRMKRPQGTTSSGYGVIYTDAAGNKLTKKFIKSRSMIQYSAHNKEGKLVQQAGIMTLIRKAKRNKKFY